MLRALPLVLLLLGACQTVATQARPPRASGEAQEGLGLFPVDGAVLPDEEIARILDVRWEVPEQVRIALLPLRHDSVQSWYGFAARSAGAGLQTAFAAVEELRKLPFVYDVSYFPEFLIPEERSIALVREAAARYQADWVLVYSTRVSTSPEARWLLRDRVEGQCLVECALLDTRSGLIPFTARSVEEIHVEERSGEDLPVLQLRAEQEAVDAAMLQNARALVAFLAEPSRP